jgi:hypothetical protein
MTPSLLLLTLSTQHPSTMLDYYFAGIAYQENSARIIPARASFASLSGEIRNVIYSSFLRYPKPISITYNAATQQFQTSGKKHANDGRIPFEVLSSSWATSTTTSAPKPAPISSPTTSSSSKPASPSLPTQTTSRRTCTFSTPLATSRARVCAGSA